jgi:protein-disulfide isomerase
MPRFLHLLLIAALAAFAAPALAATPPMPDDMTLGNPKAPVTVIEYASASCPHCARFNNNVFAAFKKAYIDTGKVHYVFREFLTDPVEVAAAGFLTARCAGQQKYFQVLDEFFHGQANAYQTGDVKGLIMSSGAKAGLTEAQIQACLSDEAAVKALNDRVDKYVRDDKINSTPTFVINGNKLPDLDHEVALNDLSIAIDPLLKNQPPAKASAKPVKGGGQRHKHKHHHHRRSPQANQEGR